MSDIDETLNRYSALCDEQGVKKSSHIHNVLVKEKKICETRVHESMHLYLAGNNYHMTKKKLTDTDMEILYYLLKNNTYVRSLDLRYNSLTDKGASFVGRLLEKTVCLQHLNLMCNDIGEMGAQFIGKSLQTNQTLRTLRMNGNKIGNKGGMYLAQALQVNETLEVLDLADSDQKTESVIALATVLNQNQTLKMLNVNRPLLFSHQEETTVHFALMLKVNKTLQGLNLSKYDMRDFGVERIAENLFDNFTLTHLDLSCNRMTRDGAKQLSRLLKRDTPLKVLDLSNNRLGCAGAQHLADALSTFNTTLTTLVLVYNEIKGKGLCALADSMKMNSTLTNLYIWGNELEESACIAFSSLLETGRLEQANTDIEPFTVDGVITMAELSYGVKKWYYWGPSFGDQAQEELKKVEM